MKKTVASLLVSSLVLTSVATASELKKTVSVSDNKTSICVFDEKFSPDFRFSKFFKYFGNCNKPSIPEIEENIPEIDSNGSVLDPNLPSEDVNTPEIPEVETEYKFAKEVLELVNKERKAQGLKELTLDSNLSRVAESHSADMKKNNYFSHTNLKGQSPFDRLKNAGISYTSAGENIAMGHKTPEQVVSGWMNSSGHRANILNSKFGKMGLGVAPNNSKGYYWTQIFTN